MYHAEKSDFPGNKGISRAGVVITCPDPCYVIRKIGTNLVYVDEAKKMIFVFSTKEKASKFMEDFEIKDSVPVWLTWHKLIKLSGNFKMSLVDMALAPGYCTIAPLCEKIYQS